MASIKFHQRIETNGKTLILFTSNQVRMRLSTGSSIPVKAWYSDDQKVKPLKEFAEFNKLLPCIDNFVVQGWNYYR